MIKIALTWISERKDILDRIKNAVYAKMWYQIEIRQKHGWLNAGTSRSTTFVIVLDYPAGSEGGSLVVSFR